MNLYVINPYRTTEPHFPIIGSVPSYYSLLWDVQLYGRGYFEVTVPATEDNAALLRTGRYICREDDIQPRFPGAPATEYKNCMIIRKVTTTYDADLGTLLTVSGKSIKDILTQRIIWDQYSATNAALTGIITSLLQENVTMPEEKTAEKLTIAETAQTTAESNLTAATTAEAAAETIYNAAVTAYEQAVDDHGASSQEAQTAKADMEADKANWDTAKETLKAAQEAKAAADNAVAFYTEQQTVAPLRQIPYVTAGIIDLPITPPMLTLSLRGENLGEWIENICTEYGLGWNLYATPDYVGFEFIAGEDRTGSVEFSADLDNLKNAEYSKSMETYRNAGLATGDGEGTDQVVAYIGGSSGSVRFEEFIQTGITKEEGTSAADYKKMVRQNGISEIIKLKKSESITGELDTDGIYKIGQDFNLGDVVTVKTAESITATTRLIEIIYADEADGTKTIGTFDEWEV